MREKREMRIEWLMQTTLRYGCEAKEDEDTSR